MESTFTWVNQTILINSQYRHLQQNVCLKSITSLPWQTISTIKQINMIDLLRNIDLYCIALYTLWIFYILSYYNHSFQWLSFIIKNKNQYFHSLSVEQKMSQVIFPTGFLTRFFIWHPVSPKYLDQTLFVFVLKPC